MVRGPLKGKESAPVRSKGLRTVVLDSLRRLIPDPKPLEPPIGYKRSPPLAEQIRAMVQGEALAYAARNAGKETFEEADDFDVKDDFDPSSPFEEVFDPPASWEDQADRLGEYIERGRRRAVAHFEEEELKKKKKEAGGQESEELTPVEAVEPKK